MREKTSTQNDQSLRAQVIEDYSKASTFVSELISILVSENLMSNKDRDDFRILNSQILEDSTTTYTNDGSSSRYLSQLFADNSNFISRLNLYFNQDNLTQIYWNQTLSSTIEVFCQNLTKLAGTLIGKSELLFNHPVVKYKDKQADTKTLFSTELINTANVCLETLDQSMKFKNSLEVILRSEVLDEVSKPEINDKFADALGFKCFEGSTDLFYKQESLQTSLFTSYLQYLYTSITNLIETAQNNEIKLETKEWTGYLYTFQNCIASLSEYRTLNTNRLELSEIIRIKFLSNFRATANTIAVMADKLDKQLTTSKVLNKKAQLTRVDQKRICHNLLTKGASQKDSEEASLKLYNYLSSHEIDPSEIIDSELKAIHDSLSRESIDHLIAKPLTSSLNTREFNEKKRNSDQISKLKQILTSFSSQIPSIIVLLTCFAFLGCGVKTSPISDATDLRPSIPYKNVETKKDQNND